MLIHSGGCNVWEPMGSAYAIALQQFLSIGWYEAHLAGIRTGPPYWAKNPATGNLATWYDLSGNGRSLAAVAPTEPTLIPTAGNTPTGYATAQWAERVDASYVDLAHLSCVAVASPALVTSLMISSWSQWGFALYHQADVMRCTVGVGRYGWVPLASGALHTLTIRFDGTGINNAARLRVRIDGVNQVVTFVGVIPAITGIDAGNVNCVGDKSNHAGGYGFSGRVMAWAAVKRTLTDAEVLTAEAALHTLVAGLP